MPIAGARCLDLPANLEEGAALGGVGIGLEAEGGVVRPHPAPHDAVHVNEHEQREHDLHSGMSPEDKGGVREWDKEGSESARALVV